MYNRYIPGPDGSYQKRSIAEPDHSCSCHPTVPEGKPFFLRDLLPGGMDTGDLMVILLLLLIAGDNEQKKRHALLTIALYFLL